MTKNQAEAIVQFFQGCYPNSEFIDSVISSAAWYTMLQDYNFDEILDASKEIVKTEKNQYKVNIAAVLEMHNGLRRKRLEEEKQKKFWEDMEKAKQNRCSPEQIDYWMKKFRDEIGVKINVETK